MEDKSDGKFKHGNQLWKLRDPFSAGRPLNFETPEVLWIEAKGYFEFQDSTPIITTETTTADKGNSIKNVEYKKPYTWSGLYVYLGVSHLDDYKAKSDFSGIIEHIGNIMYSQKFEGASIGIFNSNLIARELGIRDNQDITTKGESLNTLTKDEAIKRANELDEEY